MHTLRHTNINTTKRYITQQNKQSKEVITKVVLSATHPLTIVIFLCFQLLLSSTNL